MDTLYEALQEGDDSDNDVQFVEQQSGRLSRLVIAASSGRPNTYGVSWTNCANIDDEYRKVCTTLTFVSPL